MPQRIQLRRTKGWRKPECAVSVARFGRWGNPFRVGSPGVPDAAAAVRVYRDYANHAVGLKADARRELAGRDLACWCPLDQPCHADVLLEIANTPTKEPPRS